MARRARFSGSAAKAEAYRKLEAELRTGKGVAMNERQARIFLAKNAKDLTSTEVLDVLGTYNSESAVAAGALGFEGGKRGADAQMQAELNRVEVSNREREFSGVERFTQKDPDTRKYGIIGMLKGKGNKVSDFWANATGGKTLGVSSDVVDLIGSQYLSNAKGTYRKLYSQLRYDEVKGEGGMDANLDAGTRARGKAAYDALNMAQSTDKEMALKAAAMKKSLEAIEFEQKEEGKAALLSAKEQGIEGKDLDTFKDQWMRGSSSTRTRMLMTGLVKKSLRAVTGGDAIQTSFDKYRQDRINDGKRVDINDFLTSDIAGLSQEKQDEIKKELQKNDDAFALDLKDKPEDLLQKILDVVRTIGKKN